MSRFFSLQILVFVIFYIIHYTNYDKKQKKWYPLNISLNNSFREKNNTNFDTSKYEYWPTVFGINVNLHKLNKLAFKIFILW